jgi:hypothetical protein
MSSESKLQLTLCDAGRQIDIAKPYVVTARRLDELFSKLTCRNP